MKQLILLTSLILSTLPLIAKPVLAQSASLSISPPVVEILLAPGKQVTQTFNLKYQGEAVNLIPELHLVEPQGEDGHVKIDPNTLTPTSSPLKVTSISHLLGEPIKQTSDTTSLTLTFEAPATDIEQDIYLALVIKAVSSDTLESSSSTNPGISSLILVTVTPSGSIPLDLEITDFNPPSFHDSWSPITITPKVANQVEIMVRPEGKYEVISPSGKTIFTLPLYPHLVLGNSTRKLMGNQPSNIPTSLTWSPTWSNFGPHRLRLTLTSTGGTELSRVEQVVWFIPIRALLILTLFLIIGSSVIINISRSKLRKRNIDTESNQA